MSDYHVVKDYTDARLNPLVLDAYEQGVTPDSVGYPRIVYSLEPQPDTRDKGGIARSSWEVIVRVIGKGSTGPLETHVDAVNGALDKKRGVSRGSRVESQRIAPFRLPPYFQEGDNQATQELGGRYRVVVME